MGGTAPRPEAAGEAPCGAVGAGPTGRRRRGRVGGCLAALAALAAFLGATAVTGLPGPGPLRRYPLAELNTMVELLHAEAGEIRTPDDCWRLLDDTPGSSEGPLRDIAKVDHLRSRVVVRAWASDDGEADPLTLSRVSARIADVLERHPELDRGMIVVEPSPDGWEPNVSCARILRGPVTGF